MRKEFKGTPGKLKVMKSGEPVSNFGYFLFSTEYGAVGYWKGEKSSHTDRNWVLTEEDAKLFANALPMLETLQDIAESGSLSPEMQSTVQTLIDSVLD